MSIGDLHVTDWPLGEMVNGKIPTLVTTQEKTDHMVRVKIENMRKKLEESAKLFRLYDKSALMNDINADLMGYIRYKVTKLYAQKPTNVLWQKMRLQKMSAYIREWQKRYPRHYEFDMHENEKRTVKYLPPCDILELIADYFKTII